MRRLSFIAFIALVVTLVGARAQTQLATLSGTITDPSGAVVPGVTILSQGTGLKRSALTDTAGEHRFVNLTSGNYSLRIEKTGFQSQVREGVDLTSASEVIINSQLAIGNLSQETRVSVNVTGIDNTTSTTTGLLPEQSLAELPLDNRDLFSAVTLEPAVAPNPSSAPSLLSNGMAGQVATNGVRPNMTNVLIDGMDATDPVFGNSLYASRPRPGRTRLLPVGLGSSREDGASRRFRCNSDSRSVEPVRRALRANLLAVDSAFSERAAARELSTRRPEGGL
jgi:hypothetical protein